MATDVQPAARSRNNHIMPCAKRCFISHLYNGSIVANSRASLVRIMAIVVSVDTLSPSELFAFPGRSKVSVEYQLLQLDDGTATIGFWTPYSIIEQLSVYPGDTVECIAKLCQNGDVKRFYTQSLSIVRDPDMEHLRWAELSHNSTKSSRRFGYPALERNSEEAYRMICLRSRQNNGVSMNDLALVMQKTREQMQEMISQLQLDGLIYQNEHGKYVPL